MTEIEAKKVLAILRVAYPMMYRDSTKTDIDLAVSLWATMFADDSIDIVVAAVKAWIATDTKGFPPVIGQIKTEVFKLTDAAYAISADEAWGIARTTMRTIGCSLYDKTCTERAREMTPKEVWEVMERMGYRDMCHAENTDVLRGQFLKMWDLYVARRRERALMPRDVRQIVGSVSVSQKLPV